MAQTGRRAGSGGSRPSTTQRARQTREKGTARFEYDVSGVSHRRPREVEEGTVPAPLPSHDQLARWIEALPGTPGWNWLRARGLSKETIRRAGLGYDTYGYRTAITIPLRGNLKRRYLDGREPKYKALGGRSHTFYPDVPASGPLLLCEGEFDALLARQHGLPAVTGTAGVEAWRGSWGAVRASVLKDRRVAICFDAGWGCMEIAYELVEMLRAAGATEAWAVDLTLAGLGPGEDVTDWIVKYGWSAQDLGRFIRSEREAADE